MASPVGHAIIGVAAAAAVAGTTGTPHSGAFWIGALTASILPDLDLALRVVGLEGPRFHRNGTHSLLTIGVFIVAAWALLALTGIGLDWRLGLAWSTALLSHPIVDVFTTGPQTAQRGYGIALLWPLHPRRWFVERPVLESLDLSRCRSARDVWAGVRPEVYTFGPFALLIVVLAFVRV